LQGIKKEYIRNDERRKWLKRDKEKEEWDVRDEDTNEKQFSPRD
jgi:hypothetical protein